MGLYSDHVLPRLIDRGCAQEMFREKRERLVPRARGRVLEIGLGPGHNLPHYLPEAVDRVWGLDPSLPLLERSAEAARGAPVPVGRIVGDAEAIPLADGAADTAVMTWTLCSIPDPAAALAEVHRALAPEGRLLFCEHGASPEPGVRRWQRRLTPLWKRFSGGCHLDRDVPALLEDAGFDLEELDAAYLDGPRIGAWNFWGVAVVRNPTEATSGSP